MGDEQKPPPPMPIMSGNQRRIPDYQKEILEGGQKQPQIELTEEEKKLFNQCNRDSFYQRSLPLAILSSGSVLLASQRGLITKGKLSYWLEIRISILLIFQNQNQIVLNLLKSEDW